MACCYRYLRLGKGLVQGILIDFGEILFIESGFWGAGFLQALGFVSGNG